MKYPLELVTWIDAGADVVSWQYSDDLDDDNHLITSVVFVVKETEKNLTIAMDMGEDGSSNGRSRIPKVLIQSRKLLDQPYETKE